MDNDFLKNELAIDSLRTWLEGMEFNLAFIRSPDFHPMKLELQNFSPMLRPQDIDSKNHESALIDEEAQIEIVKNSIQRLQMALILIEAQKSLSLQIDESLESGLSMCLRSDEEQATDLVAQTIMSLSIVNKLDIPEAEKIIFIRAPFNSAVEQIHNLSEDRISQIFLDMNQDDLIRKVAQARMDISTLEILRTRQEMTRAGKQLDHAILLLKAQDEGIVPASDYLNEQIEKRLKYAEKTAVETRPRLDQIERFMQEVHYMDEYPSSLNEFNPTRYLPVSIRVIPQFTP